MTVDIAQLLRFYTIPFQSLHHTLKTANLEMGRKYKKAVDLV